VPSGTLQRCGESKAEAICNAVDAIYAALGFLDTESVNDDERGVSSENFDWVSARDECSIGVRLLAVG
jgi:hypothetical protein